MYSVVFPTFGLPIMVAPASIMVATFCVQILEIFFPRVWIEVFKQIFHSVKCSNSLIQGLCCERRVGHWWRGIWDPLRVTYISVYLEKLHHHTKQLTTFPFHSATLGHLLKFLAGSGSIMTVFYFARRRDIKLSLESRRRQYWWTDNLNFPQRGWWFAHVPRNKGNAFWNDWDGHDHSTEMPYRAGLMPLPVCQLCW